MRSHLPHFLPKIFYSDGQRVAEISWFDWAVPLKRGNQNWNIFFFAYWRGKSFNLLLLPSTSKAEEEKKEETGRSIEMRNIVSDGAVGWGGALKCKGEKIQFLYIFSPFSSSEEGKKKIPLDDSPEAEQIWFLIDCHDVRHRPTIFFFGIFLSDHFIFFVERNLGFKFPSPCHLLIWYSSPILRLPPFSYLNK